MIYVTYEGNDTYQYVLSSGKNIILSDEDLDEICKARKEQANNGFESNSSLEILYEEE